MTHHHHTHRHQHTEISHDVLQTCVMALRSCGTRTGLEKVLATALSNLCHSGHLRSLSHILMLTGLYKNLYQSGVAPRHY